jgi:hypothetical protein
LMASLVLVLCKVMRNADHADPFDRRKPGLGASLLPDAHPSPT